MGGCVKAPRIRSKNLIRYAFHWRCQSSIIFCEANAIYGIIIAVILINKVSASGYVDGNLRPDYDIASMYFAGYAIFSAGLSVGLSNITSGYGICTVVSL